MSRIIRFITAICITAVLIGAAAAPALAADYPDPAVTGIDVTALYAGIANTVVVNISNLTDVTATDFAVRLEANGEVIDTLSGQYLSGNTDVYYWPLSVYFTWTPAETGSYSLRAVVDPDESLTEADETNNSAELDVQVVELSSITASVRVEGMDSTLWNGSVTFSASTITDKQGDTWTVDHPTVLGALDEAARQGGFDYVVSSSYGMLSYVEQIGEDEPSGLNGWLYRVDWNSAGVSAIDYSLADGAEVLFYYGGWSALPLKLSVDADTLEVSESFNITVEEFNGLDWNPAADALVKAGTRSFTTDSNGQITDVSLSPGQYSLWAEKESYETYTRSNQQAVEVYAPLNLESGWNFISFPRRLASGYNTTAALFSEVDTESHSIFSYDAQSGWTALSAEDTLAPLEGVWIYSAGALELHPVFDTNPRAVPATRALYAGWNAIGFTDFTSAGAGSTLTSVEDAWAVLIGFNAEEQVYEVSIINNAPDGDSHAESRSMLPWKGYWIFLTADSVLAAISA